MSSNASLSDVRNHYDGMHITTQNSFRLELAENCETIFNDYGEIDGLTSFAFELNHDSNDINVKNNSF